MSGPCFCAADKRRYLVALVIWMDFALLTGASYGGFNRSTQQVGEIVVLVFRSLMFSLGAHSISALRH